MLALLEKENTQAHNKIAKPDFNTRTGREFLSYYLQAKFKQLVLHDKKSETPIFREIRSDIISKFAKRLVCNHQKRILIGITGESASGKTTICNKLREIAELYDMPIEILSADNYFNDISHLIQEHGCFDALMKKGFDVDSPHNFQLELLKKDLVTLSQGFDIKAPKYLVNGTGVSVPEAIEVKSKKIIIVEGVSTMYGEVSDVFDIKIYVEADKKLQRKNYVDRAVNCRNQSKEGGEKQWEYICEISKKYVQPFRPCADIVVDGYACTEYYAQLFAYLYRITNNFVAH